MGIQNLFLDFKSKIFHFSHCGSHIAVLKFIRGVCPSPRQQRIRIPNEPIMNMLSSYWTCWQKTIFQTSFASTRPFGTSVDGRKFDRQRTKTVPIYFSSLRHLIKRIQLLPNFPAKCWEALSFYPPQRNGCDSSRNPSSAVFENLEDFHAYRSWNERRRSRRNRLVISSCLYDLTIFKVKTTVRFTEKISPVAIWTWSQSWMKITGTCWTRTFGFETARMNSVKMMESTGLLMRTAGWLTSFWAILQKLGVLAGPHIQGEIRHQKLIKESTYQNFLQLKARWKS